MKSYKTGKKSLGAIIVFILFFILFYLLPKCGDDYFFYKPQSILTFFNGQVNLYNTENGRILGNSLAYLLTDYPVLASLFKSSVVCLIIMNILFLVKDKSCVFYVICCILCITMPSYIFAQTYAWGAGFYNYVPPVLGILVSIRLIFDIFLKSKQYNVKKYAIILLLTSFLSSFFMENCTLYIFLFSIVVLFMYYYREKKVCIELLGHFIGAIAGTTIMFLSPVYRNVANQEDGYRTMALSIVDIFAQIRMNYETVSTLTIGGNTILYLLLSFLGIIIVQRYANKAVINLVTVVLTSVPIYYWLSRKMLIPNFSITGSLWAFLLDVVVNMGYYITFFFIIKECIEDVQIRWLAFVILLSILVLNGSLLLVTPIGPRCFYASYIMLVTLVLLMLKYTINKKGWNLKEIKYMLGVVVVAIFATYIFIALQQHEVYVRRNIYIEKAIENKSTKIVIPKYEYPQYIHEPETSKLGYDYYISEIYDITWEYIPYKEWLSQYYYK